VFAYPSSARGLLASDEEGRRRRKRLLVGLLCTMAVAALQGLLFGVGLAGVGFCRLLFGIPFYLAYLPLASALLCLIALRLKLRFGLIFLCVVFVNSAYREAALYEMVMSFALSPRTVYFREVVARFPEIVVGMACEIPYAPLQVVAANAFHYATSAIGLLGCIACRFWPRREKPSAI